MTVVYLDSLALLNFSVNYLILLSTVRLTGAVHRKWRLALGSLLGSGYAVAVQFLPCLGFWPFRIAAGVLICLAGIGKTELLRRSILFLGTAFAFGGGVWAIYLMAGGSGKFGDYITLNPGSVILCAGVCCAVLDLGFRMSGKRSPKERAKVELFRNGTRLTLLSLRDSGDELTDSANNQPIVLTETRHIKNIMSKYEACLIDTLDPVGSLERLAKHGVRARLVPYRAVGTSLGLLIALRADKMSVDGRVYKGALIALSPTPISDTGTYSAIIGHDA